MCGKLRAMAPQQPDFRTALAYWHRLGWVSFGGPAGQIAIMQQDLVDRRQWIGQTPFLHALNFCMLLPGPEAQQLATYIGWRLHGWRGGVAAGALFVLPGALVLWLLSWLLVAHGTFAPVAAAFDGIKPVVIAIVVHAVWRIGKRALKGPAPLILAAAAFIAIRVLGIDFPWIVLAAALIGAMSAQWAPGLFAPVGHGPGAATAEAAPRHTVAGGFRRSAFLIALFVLLWAVPVFAVIAMFGPDPYSDIVRLFTTAAFVTFGGAYAVLPYVADAAVNDYGWLDAAAMINGLALAETTPGPLILVLQYVGFTAGWTRPGSLDPLLAATLAAALTTYVTFLPSFLLIFLGAPYIERLGNFRPAASALSAITAAVVGVVLNLAAFLGQAVLWPPEGFAPWSALLAVAALAVQLRWSVAIHWLVLAGGGLGLVVAALGLVT
jgi:chromate transporter